MCSNTTRFSAATLLILAIAGGSLALSGQTTHLRLVSTAWSPFTNEPGQPRFALDLVEAGLARIGLTTATTIVDAAQFTTALLSGKFDGSAAAWKDPEREKALLFSEPYLENRLILVARRGTSVSATRLTDLEGKRIAVVEGYSYGEATEMSGPIFVRSRSEEDSLRLLLDSNVDYTLMDELVVQYIVRNYAEEARTRLQIGSTPLLRRQLYLAVSRAVSDAPSIIEKFNAQLRGMISDHTYHRLLHVDWVVADVDGDGRAEYVPRSDRMGATEPKRAYSLLFTDPSLAPKPEPKTEGRFLLGGSIYDGWTTVPDRFKVEDPQRPDPNKAMAGIFRFVW
ncbi:MAG TPA: transporter substrate-binding domain-containing protein [Vicinamibacterales bacterium]|nr:transporter substrate-binding domain-containing protein [Vicinamibacterales bacterium]